MASAKQLPSGSWRVRVSKGTDATGKRIYESVTRPTKKEAEYAALEIELHHKDIARDSSAMTLKEAIEAYIDARRGLRSPSTLAGYEKMGRLYFTKYLDIPLRKITPQMVQREIDQLSKMLSPKTIRNVHGFLNAIFAEYRPSVELKTKLPPKTKFIPHIPDAEELKQILIAVEDTDIKVAVHLAVLLGMRMSEIRALRFADVRNDSVVVRNAIVDVDGEPVEKQTKSYEGSRTIPAPKDLIKLIYSVPHTSPQEHIVPLSGQAIYKRFARILEKNSLPHMRFHDLRHANASVMLLLGVPDKYAMERLGHATNSVLKNVYQHTLSSEKMQIAEKINRYFF